MVISSVRDLFFLPLSLPWPSLLPAPLGFLLEACFNLYSLGMANKSTLNEAVSLSRTFDTPFLQTPWCPPDSQPTYLSICLKAHFSQCRGEVGHACTHLYKPPTSLLAVGNSLLPWLPGFCTRHWRKSINDWAFLHTIMSVRTHWFLTPNYVLLFAYGLYPVIWHLIYSDACDTVVVSHHFMDVTPMVIIFSLEVLTTPTPCTWI